MTDSKALLVLSHVSKNFGARKALNDISLTIFEGEIIGVNKNGKLRIKLLNFQVNEFDVKEIKFLG